MLNSFSKLSLDGLKAESTFVQDITEQYFTACKNGLQIGELVRLEDFSLQDSIAALEIMDPKMDNGVIDVLEAESEPYDCSTTLSASEMILIMDRILASEMTWHTGSSLSQTLYTCVYLQKVLGKTRAVTHFSAADQGADQSKKLLDQVLYSYVVATIKQSEVFREEYLTGYLYEEEDVSSGDFGLELLPFESTENLVADLKDGLNYLSTLLQTGTADDLKDLSQLALRLKLRLNIQQLLDNLHEPENWQTINEGMLQILSDIEPSERLPENLEDIFNTNIQRALISTSPPRPIMCMSASEAYSALTRTSTDLIRLLPITTPAKDSPTCMLAFFEMIRKDDPQSLPLVRSRLQNLFLANKMAQHAGNKKNFLTTAIQEVCGQRNDLFDPKHAVVELPQDSRFQINEIVSTILSRLELPYLDYFKILCHNPGRQRRNLCKILVDLDILQAESEESDTTLAALTGEIPKPLSNGHTSLSFPISSWVFSTKLDIASTILTSGFETDLYRPFEWTMIYWQLDNIQYLQYEHLGSLLMDRLPNYSLVRAHLAHRLLLLEALRSLSRAYLHLLAALDRLGLLQRPNLKFSSHALLYRHRMGPFSKLVSPPPVTYETFLAETSFEGFSEKELLREAAEAFTVARSKLNTLSKRGPSQLLSAIPALVQDFKIEVKGLVGCCITNSLLISKLLKQEQAWYNDKVLEWDNTKFSRHYPIISIVERH